ARDFLVVNDEPDEHPQRRGIRQTAELALLDVEDRVAQAIAHVLERGISGIADDREHAAEGGVQPHFLARFRRDVELQEFLIRIDLDRKEIRDAENARQLPEILADTLLFSERIRHACYSGYELAKKKTTRPPRAVPARGLRVTCM